MKPASFQVGKYQLKPYLPKDEDRFVEMNIDPQVAKFMDGGVGDAQAGKELFQKIFNLYASTSSDRIFYVWGIYEEDKLCGHFELKETEHTAKDELEIVYMIHPAERGRGIMSTILNFFQKEQSIFGKNIIATVHPQNNTSLRLLEKWGIQTRKIIKNGEDAFLKIWLKRN